MKTLVGTWACANALYHLNFRLFIFGSNSRNQDEFTVSFISRRKFIFLFFEEAVRILSLCEFSWSFGLQSWCTGSILFQKQISLPLRRQLLELALVLILLTIWISGCLSLANIVEIRMNSLSVFISRWKFIFHILEEAVQVLSLCKFYWFFLDCSYGALAVFYLRKQISLP